MLWLFLFSIQFHWSAKSITVLQNFNYTKYPSALEPLHLLFLIPETIPPAIHKVHSSFQCRSQLKCHNLRESLPDYHVYILVPSLSSSFHSFIFLHDTDHYFTFHYTFNISFLSSSQEGRNLFFTTVFPETSPAPETQQVVFSVINVKHQSVSLTMAIYLLILLV